MLEARRTRPVLIALLIVAIALITIDFRDGGTSSAHSFGGRLFGPVEHLSDDVTGLFRGGGNSGEISALQQQNDQLRAQLAQAQVSSEDARPAGQRAAAERQARRQDRARLRDRGRRRLLGHGDDQRGQRDGITTDETVLNGDGLVGTVIATARPRDRPARQRRGRHGRHPDGGLGPDRRAHRHRRLVRRRRPAQAHPVQRERHAQAGRNWSPSARSAAARTFLTSRSAT